ncbi:hypothetical protein Sputw3181_2942 [Shewanella sp. W3-18-1]|uniref:hypothetical protein n=1 Tax=Shewanella sp. (strain W3-18-1) TaxID=351745 RepID=UPI00005FDAD1|nr:hypothetical protein [Shewanella sp. W3-18-1]ABM25759.1 hypothetical protein Sputw3181_2942 [Shewanella sp. W3-18-1]
MTLIEAINAFKQAKAEFEQKTALMVELRSTRLPELRQRLSSNNFSMQQAQRQMRNAVTDEDFDAAKQQYAQAEATYNDCAQLITNCESKLSFWGSTESSLFQRKVTEAQNKMWDLKRDEVLASFPEQLPDNIRLGIQKLASIHTLKGGNGISTYGNHINQIYSEIDRVELATTKEAMLTEMGI